MGIISSGIQSIARERARQTSKIEKIHSEVNEAVADDAVAYARILAVEDDTIDIDDIVGVSLNAE